MHYDTIPTNVCQHLFLNKKICGTPKPAKQEHRNQGVVVYDNTMLSENRLRKLTCNTYYTLKIKIVKPFFAKKYIAPICFYSCSYIIYNMLREVVGCLFGAVRLRIWGVGGVLLHSASCMNTPERAALSKRVCVSSCSRTGCRGGGVCLRASRQDKQHIQAGRENTSLLLLI